MSRLRTNQVLLSPEAGDKRQQSTRDICHISHHPKANRNAAPQSGRIGIHLCHPPMLRQIIAEGKVRSPQHEQIAMVQSPLGIPPPERTGHADSKWVFCLHYVFSCQSISNRSLHTPGESQQFFPRLCTPRPTEKGNAARGVDELGKPGYSPGLPAWGWRRRNWPALPLCRLFFFHCFPDTSTPGKGQGFFLAFRRNATLVPGF